MGEQSIRKPFPSAGNKLQHGSNTSYNSLKGSDNIGLQHNIWTNPATENIYRYKAKLNIFKDNQ